MATKCKYGIEETSNAVASIISDNYVSGQVSGTIKLAAGSISIIRDNLGWKTENSGTATVANGQTHVHVTHSLATTPTRVQITPRENPTNAVAFWWVDGLSTTEFVINVNADPGASNLDFDWRAVVGEGN